MPTDCKAFQWCIYKYYFVHTVATAQLLNEQLLKSLFEAHYTSLVRTAFRFLNNLPAAEDLVQEVFCTLWEKRTDLHIESYEGYLRRAVFNRCITAIKNNKANTFIDIEEETWPVTSYHATDQNILAKETAYKIDVAINSLPTACRTVFLLSRFENLSNKEIAQELNLSVKTVENQMTKALRILKTALLSIYFALFLKIF